MRLESGSCALLPATTDCDNSVRPIGKPVSPIAFFQYGKLMGGLGLLLIMLSFSWFTAAPGAKAEGSRELTSNGGSRPNTEWRSSTYGGPGSPVLRRTTVSVYAKAGEVVNMGSSAVGVTGTATGNAVLVATGGDLVNGPFLRNCIVDQPGNGFISTRAQEVAGPVPNTGGYKPCTFTVTTTGIYDVAFWGPDGANTNTNISPNGSITTPDTTATQGGGVSMWDITVRDPNSTTPNTDINGRAFSKSIALFTGNNGRLVNSKLYAVTLDGFIYLTDLRGVDPNGFAVYGNNIGFYDSDGATPLYHDLYDGVNDQLTAPQGGVKLAPPLFPLFFNAPKPEAISANGITLTPALPQVTGASFAGNVSGFVSTVGSGGTFTISTNGPGIYELVISRDGVDFDPTNPNNRVLRGVKTAAGPQAVSWDGKDNSGVDFPVNTTPAVYPVQFVLHGGEYHFPLLDPENSTNGGPGYTLQNPPGPANCSPMPFGCTTGYFDDRGYRTVSGATVGTLGTVLPGGVTPPPAPYNAVLGFDTTSITQRAFGTANSTTGWGDKKGLDLWTFFPSSVVTAPVKIIANTGLLITKDDGGITVAPGGTVVYTLSYTNTSGIALNNVIVTDTVPANTTFTTAGSTPTWTGCATGAAPGTVCTYSLGNLAAGATGTLKIAFVVDNPYPAGANPVVNTAFIRDGGGGGGNGGSGGDLTPVSGIAITKSDGGISTAAGQSFAYTIAFTNTGGVTLTNVIVTDTVPANTTFNAANSTAGWTGCTTGSPAGTVCTISVGNLAIGQSGSVQFGLTVNNPLPAGVTQIANTAFIRDGGGSGGTGGSGGDVTPVSGIAFSKSDGGISTGPGQTFAYTLAYTNTGNTVLNNVIITDTVPANTTFNSAASTAGWTGCTTGSPAGTVCTFALGNLAIGQSGSVLFGLTVDNPLPAGVTQIANTAFIRDDGGNGGNGGSGGDVTPVSSIAFSKSDGGISSGPGQSFAYTLAYTNTGNTTLNNVIITDTVPANTTFSTAASTTGWTGCANGAAAGTVCTFTLGNLAVGQSGSVKFGLTVDNPLPAGVTQIFNTAFIRDGGGSGSNGGSGSDSTPVSGSPTPTPTSPAGSPTPTPTPTPGTPGATTPAAPGSPSPGPGGTPTPTPGAVVSPPYIYKSSDASQVTSGQQFTFIITATNPSTNPLDNVVVVDNMPTAFQVIRVLPSQGTAQVAGQLVTVQLGSLAPGDVATIRIIVQVQPGVAGDVANNASLSGIVKDPNGSGAGGAGGGGAGGGQPLATSASTSATSTVKVLAGLPNTGRGDTDSGWSWLSFLQLLVGGSLVAGGAGLVYWGQARKKRRS